MKKVYSSQDRLMVGHVKNILENEDIECFIKNEYLTSAVGEIPPIESWLEVWIIDDSQNDRAHEILEKAFSSENLPQTPWTCSQCGEELEGQFSECWSCGTSRDLD
jgi:rubrerythrin